MVPYRRVAIQLHYDLSDAKSRRSVLLVAPTEQEACARSSMLLARCAAQELRQSVLLVDLCLRDPATSRLLGCQDRQGFADLLADPTRPIDELALQANCDSVWFLPSGSAGCRSRQPAPEAMDTVLRAAEARYGLVILAGGAVLTDCTALAMAPYAGCVLLAVVENQTKVSDLAAAGETLSLCRTRKRGLLLTTPLRRNMPAVTLAHAPGPRPPN